MKYFVLLISILLLSSLGFAQGYPDQYYSDHVCDLKVERNLDLSIDGINSYLLIDGIGTIDQASGMLTYLPDTSGVFIFTIQIDDGQSTDDFMVYDTLILNSLPKVICQDSTVYLCSPEEICIYINSEDPDDDYTHIFRLEGIGQFEQLDGNNAVNCFMPGDIDSADYLFIFRAADSCSLPPQGLSTTSFPPCCADSSLITVVMNRPPQILCPDDITLNDPGLGEYCFDIGSFDPEGDDVTYSVISGNATISDNHVCFNIDGPANFVIEIEATDICGRADTCMVPIEITFEEMGEPYFDIKPTSCPNPLDIKGNTSRNSMMPAAILGTDDFDVRTIDPASLLLEGIAPIRYDYEDVTTPADKSEDSCACTEEEGDGYEDMTLKFDKNDLIDILGHLYDGQIIELTITGTLYDGTEFEASDCMIVRARKTGGNPSQVDQNTEILTPVMLLGNHPNPFNPSTIISYRLSGSYHIKLEIINVSGQVVAVLVDEQRQAGIHRVIWDATSFASGVYFYRLTSDEYVETKKMILMK